MFDRLTPIERFNVRVVRSSFMYSRINNLLRWGQRFIGAQWIRLVTSRLIHLVGVERLPPPHSGQGLIWASNHRTFFDMYVANAYLFRLGYLERVLYPVRSQYFYDTISGFFVNGLMSFWSMYPPIFRERKRASLNHVAFSELARAITQGRSVGIHPEGTRSLGSDPYDFLPPQSGVGRLIHLAQAPLIPFYINGLTNNVREQIWGNMRGHGPPIIIVFGEPMDLTELRSAPGTGKTYRSIAEQVMASIATLSIEERAVRAQLQEQTRTTPANPTGRDH